MNGSYYKRSRNVPSTKVKIYAVYQDTSLPMRYVLDFYTLGIAFSK